MTSHERSHAKPAVPEEHQKLAGGEAKRNHRSHDKPVGPGRASDSFLNPFGPVPKLAFGNGLVPTPPVAQLRRPVAAAAADAILFEMNQTTAGRR